MLNDRGQARCVGPWTLSHLSRIERQLGELVWPSGTDLRLDASGVTAMDTGGAVVFHCAVEGLRREGRRVDVEGLRSEFTELLSRVEAAAGRAIAGKTGRPPLGRRLGRRLTERARRIVAGLSFIGESATAWSRHLIAPSEVRWRLMLHSLELDGVQALPIVGLLTFLMGVVIAYQGAEQLRHFGANIFVVDLVGISLLREIAPIIVAILLAGRSGSAYAAEIGTMKVTEELDAIRTLGLSPVNLLVMPRALALMIAVPLLTVYADALGVFGGMLIAASELSISFTEFMSRFDEAVALRHFLIGLAKAPFFAMIIALVGCYQGFQIEGGVDQVGRRTTLSVVQSIFLVIIFDAFCSILLNWWDL